MLASALQSNTLLRLAFLIFTPGTCQHLGQVACVAHQLTVQCQIAHQFPRCQTSKLLDEWEVHLGVASLYSMHEEHMVYYALEVLIYDKL